MIAQQVRDVIFGKTASYIENAYRDFAKKNFRPSIFFDSEAMNALILPYINKWTEAGDGFFSLVSEGTNNGYKVNMTCGDFNCSFPFDAIFDIADIERKGVYNYSSRSYSPTTAPYAFVGKVLRNKRDFYTFSNEGGSSSLNLLDPNLDIVPRLKAMFVAKKHENGFYDLDADDIAFIKTTFDGVHSVKRLGNYSLSYEKRRVVIREVSGNKIENYEHEKCTKLAMTLEMLDENIATAINQLRILEAEGKKMYANNTKSLLNKLLEDRKKIFG